jgi:ABC-2 type transport system permease protein
MTALRNVGWIAGRELRSYFLQPLAWVVLTAMVLFNGFSFASLATSADIANVPAVVFQRFLFTGLLFWMPLLIALPVIAMRLIPEERQTGTLETLLTAPVTENQVAVGKLIAGLAFYAVLLAPFVVYQALLGAYGEVDWLATASGFLGLALVGGYLLSAALFASALSRNQIVAAVVGFVLVVALYVFPLLLAELFHAGVLGDVLEYVNLYAGMDEMARGLVSTRRLVYPLSGIVFFTFATARLVELARGR